jgi:hypothetical protein
VEVRDRQQVRELGLGPQTLVEAAAAWAVPVAARVVGVVPRSAAIAEGEVSPQPACATGQDVGYSLAPLVIEMQAA